MVVVSCTHSTGHTRSCSSVISSLCFFFNREQQLNMFCSFVNVLNVVKDYFCDLLVERTHVFCPELDFRDCLCLESLKVVVFLERC